MSNGLLCVFPEWGVLSIILGLWQIDGKKTKQNKKISHHYDDSNSLKKLHYKTRPFHGQPLDGPQVQAG